MTTVRKKRHIYHYHAVYQIQAGLTHHIDGVVLLTNKVETVEQYCQLKKLIDHEHFEIMYFASLSYHGLET